MRIITREEQMPIENFSLVGAFQGPLAEAALVMHFKIEPTEDGEGAEQRFACDAGHQYLVVQKDVGQDAFEVLSTAPAAQAQEFADRIRGFQPHLI
ncbi:MAG: hypothetical protein AB7E85_09115 [Pseudobdellovibrionaceae bacterium]